MPTELCSHVFVDTEFSGLGSDPRLISIGMVSENGAELYIELTSGWDAERCSSWVKDNVLPLLGCGEQMTRRDAAQRIERWLSGIPSRPKLMVDSNWDADLIKLFFTEYGVDANLFPIEVITFSSRESAASFESARREHFREGVKQHHALSDACALRFAWRRCRQGI